MTGAAIVRENRFVATENGTIFVRITGCGDPLLMIHGTASDADYFKDSVPLLSDSCKVISYDRNGCSRSIPFPEADFGIRGEMKDAAALLDLAGDRKLSIFALSAGALAALELALFYPERIKRLILYEPSFCISEESVNRLKRTEKEIGSLVSDGRTAAALLRFVDLIGGLDPESPPVSEKQQLANFDNFRFFLDHQLGHLPCGEEISARLEKLAVPCCILCGTKDGEGLFYQASHEAAQLLGIRPAYVEGFHNYPKDHPQEFSDVIRSMLT